MAEAAADQVLLVVRAIRREGVIQPIVDDMERRLLAALAAAKAEERARCVAIVKTGAFVFQSDPPLAATAARLDELRAQIAAALAREAIDE